MATNPTPIIFKITEAGKQAALSASDATPKVQINLSQVAIGSGQYTPIGNETDLQNEVSRSALVSGGVEVSSNTLRFTSAITGDTKAEIYEVGLFTDDGVLFAVAASETSFFTIHPNVTFAASFGLSLDQVGAGNVTVSTDPSGALSLVIMENHLAAINPHPQYLGATHITDADPHAQYLNVSRFQLLLQTMIPFGYQHNTHDPINPKPLFDELMGIDTAWRRLTGVIRLATDPNDTAINQHSILLGQKGNTELTAAAARPHVYPLRTTHVFERYDPATVIETVWTVQSDKNSANEGDIVTFTISANNLPDGQILDWAVKEGTLNSENNDITSPEKSENGTVILKNGKAVVSFTTTPDENEVETQKYVRLTVGAPANLSINVPINDAGRNEILVRISQSTNNGISLDEYYLQQTGAYPRSTDKIRFIVDSGVVIIAASTSTQAVVKGANMPASTAIIIENRGSILGRGGDAGLAATLNYETNFTDLSQIETTQAEVGGTGGTAIKGDMTIDNYGLIAGGGGGGGGAGLFISGVGNVNGRDTGDGSSYGAGNSGGGGGGAPLGRRYPNPHSYEEYLEFFPANNKYLLPPLNNPTTGRTYDLYSELEINQPTDPNNKSHLRGEVFNPTNGGLKSELIKFDGFRHPNPDFQSNFYIPYYLDSNKIAFKLWSWSGDRAFVDIGMRQSTNATTEQKGLGGIGLSQLGSVAGIKRIAEIANFNITKNKGGDGGAIGEAGQAAVLGQFYVTEYDGYIETTAKSITKSQTRLVIEPKAGGLAGFAIEGNVTVNNFASGTVKGR